MGALTDGPRDARDRAVARALELHGEAVTRLALRLLADREAARDVAQEAFVRLHERLDEVDDPGPWLRAVAARLALDRLRRLRREERAVSALAAGPGRDPLEAGPEASEVRGALLDALARLPDRQREVVLLRVVEGETFPALAGALGISEGSAKTHLRRGLAALRGMLGRLAGAERSGT